MTYKALYRKYRPTTFEDVTGQESIIKTLKNSIKSEKIGHAYLFAGTRGTGKTTIAKIFAKSINCLDMKDGEPCGKCAICLNKNTDEIQDIIEIDAASNNGVDEIREIKNKANLVPTMCKYKVYIIDEVHMLSIGAFNALLKTLEEPPSHAIFILATTEPQKLPVTIISRCQRFDFKKLSVEDIVKRLKYITKKEKININDDCLEEIARLSDGAMRDAIGLLEQVSSYSEEEIRIEDIYELTGNVSSLQLATITEYIVNNDIEKLLDISQNMYETGKNFEKLSEALMTFLMNVLICKNANSYFKKKNIYNKDLIVETEKKISKELLMYLIRELNIFIEDIKRSSNPSVLFDLFLLKSTNKLNEKENTEVAEEKVKEHIVEPVKEKIKDEAKTIKEELTALEQKEEVKVQPEIEVKIVENEYTNEIQMNIVDDKKEELSECKKILVNNTIALAEKEELNFMQESFKKIQTYLINKKYKDAVTILLDSKISAVSKDHLLLTYKYDCMVEEHDKQKKIIENLIYEITEKKYTIVAITESCWNELRPYYVNLKKKNKKIDLIEEIDEDQEATNKNIESDSVIDSAINVFGEDLVEMEG